MIIHFERTGGFTGIPLRTAIDTQTLSSAEREELEQMLADARFFELPAQAHGQKGGAAGSGADRGADRFHYRLTVEGGGKKHTVEFGDESTPEGLEDVLSRLTALARRK